MRLLFIASSGKVELDVNPSSTIGDLINLIQAHPQFTGQEVEIRYKLKVPPSESLLTDLGVCEGDNFIVACKKCSENGQKPKRKGFKFPCRSDVKAQTKEDDPPSFEADVANLMEMGFPREDCEKALRVSFYNPDRASMYLVTGAIPKDAVPEKFDKDERETSSTQQLSPEDQKIIKDISNELGIQVADVTQYYFACDKDPEKTKACIRGYN